MQNKLRAIFIRFTTGTGRSRARLEADNQRLREEIGKRVMDETFVTGLYLDRGVSLGCKGGAAQMLAEMLAQQIEETNALNYLEMSFTSKQVAPDTQYLVTIQKCRGKTPHQFRMDAENRLRRKSESLVSDLLQIKATLQAANATPKASNSGANRHAIDETLVGYIDGKIAEYSGA